MILPFSSVEHLSIRDGCAAIVAAPKRRLADAKLFDFIMQEGAPLPGVHGVYFYFAADGTTCLFVGKNSSQQFIERIPWHFAVSDGSWQNHFLRYYRTHHHSESLFEAAKAAGDCYILLMPVLPHEVIGRAERFFRVFQQPRFNTLSSGKRLTASIGLDMNLGEIVRKGF